MYARTGRGTGHSPLVTGAVDRRQSLFYSLRVGI